MPICFRGLMLAGAKRKSRWKCSKSRSYPFGEQVRLAGTKMQLKYHLDLHATISTMNVLKWLLLSRFLSFQSQEWALLSN